MPQRKFYYDDVEGEGPSRKTSHPAFVQYFSRDFYYDCLDDFSPFGNDTGADVLAALEDFYQNGGARRNILKWLFETIDDFGFKYQSKDLAPLATTEVIEFLEKEDPNFLPCLNQAVIAAAFGQGKISGAIKADLVQLGLAAIEREKLVANAEHLLSDNADDFQKHFAEKRLESLPHYKQRLAEMESDLLAFAEKQERDSGSSPE